jgi:hypothetical protein
MAGLVQVELLGDILYVFGNFYAGFIKEAFEKTIQMTKWVLKGVLNAGGLWFWGGKEYAFYLYLGPLNAY